MIEKKKFYQKEILFDQQSDGRSTWHGLYTVTSAAKFSLMSISQATFHRAAYGTFSALLWNVDSHGREQSWSSRLAPMITRFCQRHPRKKSCPLISHNDNGYKARRHVQTPFPIGFPACIISAGSCGFCICQLKMLASACNFTWKPLFIFSSGRRGLRKHFQGFS